MGGYIGAKTGTLVASASDIRGDISATDTTPEITLKNTTETDADGTRSGKITFKGEQSGGEESVLAQIQGSHDGTADDEKGDLIFKTNDGSDGASPTERLRIDSAGKTTITVEGNDSALELISTDADASIGPVFQLKRNSASPADNDQIGRINIIAKNDADQDVDYVRFVSQIRDVSDGSEDGRLALNTVVNGTMMSRLNIEPTETVFNDESNDVDFRVESNGKGNMFVVDGGNDIVGIGRAPDPNDGGAGSLQMEGNDGMAMRRPSQTNSFILRPLSSGDGMRFTQGGTGDRMTIDSSGNVLVGMTTNGLTSSGIGLVADGTSHMYSGGTHTLELGRGGSDGDILKFNRSGSTVGNIGVSSGSYLTIGTGDTGILFDPSGDRFYPCNASTQANRDNAIDVGASNVRFDDIYATNGTIQTSDQNEKQDIEDLSEAELRVATTAKGLIKKFRWKDAVEKKGNDARIHVGIIAQDLKAAFEAEGLDAGRYAMFISNTWWEADRVVPAVEANEEEGIEAVAEHTVTDTFDTKEEAPEGATERTRLGVRYPELLAFIIGAM